MIHSAIPWAFLVPTFLFTSLLIMAVAILPFWMIWKKAGFSPWLSLLMVIPMVGVVMLYVLAFSEWRVVPTPGAPMRQF